MIERAGSRGADVLVLDLEDGVHPDRKDDARAIIRDSYRRVDFGDSEVFVRANAVDSPWIEADLAMLETLRPEGVVLPKVESASVVATVEKRLPGIALFLMIETARGVLESKTLAALPGVRGLLFGAADYRESLRAGRLPDESELLYARMSILHAARAAGPGVEAFDTPWFEYKDLEGLEASSGRARSLGFDGKTAIHPSQVETINRAFTPTLAEVERARAIVELMERAFADGRNVATLGNEMIEALHLAEARRILARAER